MLTKEDIAKRIAKEVKDNVKELPIKKSLQII